MYYIELENATLEHFRKWHKFSIFKLIYQEGHTELHYYDDCKRIAFIPKFFRNSNQVTMVWVARSRKTIYKTFAYHGGFVISW